MATGFIIAYIATAMVIGILGNTLVIYVFGYRYRASAFNTLITILAIYDLLSSSVHMPLDIVGMFHPDILPYSIMCKAACTLVSLSVIASSVVLMSVAILRYRGISKPFGRNLTIREAKIIGIFTLIPAFGFAWPVLVLFENRKIHIKSGIYINMCGVHDAELMTYGVIFQAVLLTLFMINFVALVILYGIIARFIIKRKRIFSEAIKTKSSIDITAIMGSEHQNKTHKLNLANRKMSSDSVIELTPTEDCNKKTSEPSVSFPAKSTISTQPSNPSVSFNVMDSGCAKENSNEPKVQPKVKKSNNGLLMMFLVTFVFCLSYMPHLSYAMFVLLSKMDDVASISTTVTFGVLIRSYYINNFANPIIYTICSGDFRAEIIQMLRRIFRHKE